MSEVKKLEQVIQNNMVLHEHFCQLIEKEKDLFGENKLNEISGQRKLKDDLEIEIKKNDSTISEIFKQIETGIIKIDETQKKEISNLTDKYRFCIDNTINKIEQTGKLLHSIKDDTMKQLKMFDKKKKALNIYKGYK